MVFSLSDVTEAEIMMKWNHIQATPMCQLTMFKLALNLNQSESMLLNFSLPLAPKRHTLCAFNFFYCIDSRTDCHFTSSQQNLYFVFHDSQLIMFLFLMVWYLVFVFIENFNSLFRIF